MLKNSQSKHLGFGTHVEHLDMFGEVLRFDVDVGRELTELVVFVGALSSSKSPIRSIICWAMGVHTMRWI